MKRILITTVTLVATILFITPLRAGPPLICHQIDIGDAKSLPWGENTHDKGKSYDVRRVPTDTLDILTPEAPILVRMETMRRAAMHIDRNRDLADALLGKLMSRIIDAEANGNADALAYFDAGYLAGCYHQLGVETSFGPASAEDKNHGSGVPGYAWVARALKLTSDGKTVPTMHVAAALMTVDSRGSVHQEHLRAALAARVGKESAAERSLLEWIATINGKTLDSLCAELGLGNADSVR